MELTVEQAEDLAAARLIRNELDVTNDPSLNLLQALAAGLLQEEIPTVQLERKYVDQSIAGQIGSKAMELTGVAA